MQAQLVNWLLRWPSRIQNVDGIGFSAYHRNTVHWMMGPTG